MTVSDKILTLRKSTNMRASELGNFFAFSHSKTAISFNILLVLLILYLTNIHVYKCHVQDSNYICIIHYTINAVPYYYLWYGVIYKRKYTDKTLTLRKSVYMRASGANELRKFSHFYILKRLFLSIFCWYFRYLICRYKWLLVGLHVPTNFEMYRQNSKKAFSLMDMRIGVLRVHYFNLTHFCSSGTIHVCTSAANAALMLRVLCGRGGWGNKWVLSHIITMYIVLLYKKNTQKNNTFHHIALKAYYCILRKPKGGGEGVQTPLNTRFFTQGGV